MQETAKKAGLSGWKSKLGFWKGEDPNSEDYKLKIKMLGALSADELLDDNKIDRYGLPSLVVQSFALLFLQHNINADILSSVLSNPLGFAEW